MTNGIVFDIQRFSLHDGPGIRTTIFLKGCSLSCDWCHNPEAISPAPQLAYQLDQCDQCLECIGSCPNGAHSELNGMHVYDRTLCQSCGDCVEVCPQGALSMTGKRMTVDEIMAIVKRDRAYYDLSGGGVTLSGGEPLVQFDFARDLFDAAKSSGTNCCLETCGAVSQDRFAELLPLVDVFLFDYKATDSETHRRLTGASNELILSNLDFLYNNGANIHLRCPLIPGVNDEAEHLAGIAALSARYPRIEKVELLPYHNIGNSKYERYGLTNPLPGLETAGDMVIRPWVSTLCSLGCEKARLH